MKKTFTLSSTEKPSRYVCYTFIESVVPGVLSTNRQRGASMDMFVALEPFVSPVSRLLNTDRGDTKLRPSGSATLTFQRLTSSGGE